MPTSLMTDCLLLHGTPFSSDGFFFFLIWVFVVVWLVKGWDLFGVLEGVVGFVLGFGVAVVGGVGICQNQ